ncbi:hypothetical protein CCFV1_ORF009 [Cotesia congregata filamentous virus 1]|uniref:Uncharacterized protein n=1 Tax=Cotesia congregata filamentous virus 1 TaxID=3064291 RepID=A0ABC8QK42_9VIRU|nr:hypothetical protein CCFV1_ORF009 [Cotesia congregata filamentous virus 1]
MDNVESFSGLVTGVYFYLQYLLQKEPGCMEFFAQFNKMLQMSDLKTFLEESFESPVNGTKHDIIMRAVEFMLKIFQLVYDRECEVCKQKKCLHDLEICTDTTNKSPQEIQEIVKELQSRVDSAKQTIEGILQKQLMLRYDESLTPADETLAESSLTPADETLAESSLTPADETPGESSLTPADETPGEDVTGLY